jgi:hypothetical protein
LVGHLHHGKTSFVDCLMQQTHPDLRTKVRTFFYRKNVIIEKGFYSLTITKMLPLVTLHLSTQTTCKIDYRILCFNLKQMIFLG